MPLTHSTHHVFSLCLFKPGQGSSNFHILTRFNVQTFKLSIHNDRYHAFFFDVHNGKHHAFFFVEIRYCCKKTALFSSSSCIVQLDIVAHNDVHDFLATNAMRPLHDAYWAINARIPIVERFLTMFSPTISIARMQPNEELFAKVSRCVRKLQGFAVRIHPLLHCLQAQQQALH